MPDEIDLLNKFMVGTNGDYVVVNAFGRRLSRDDAILLAAWLVAMADGDDQRFAPLLSRVLNTLRSRPPITKELSRL